MTTPPAKPQAVSEFENAIHSALETYSNVHRGSGHFSRVTTHLYEKAREIFLEYMGLNKGSYVVIFCTPRQCEFLTGQLKKGCYKVLSSQEFGLATGLRVIAAEKKALPEGVPFQTGGGTTKLISRDWVIWAGAPERFEAGTPSIINVIALAKAVLLAKKYGSELFTENPSVNHTADEILQEDDPDNLTGVDLLNKLRQEHIGGNISVPTRSGRRRFINLDNGASTPTFKPIRDAYFKALYLEESHRQDVISMTREICSNFLGAPLSSYDIIFTSNTTEAINLAAQSLSREASSEEGLIVLNTLLEHNSNELPWRISPGLSLIRMDVDRDGFIDLNEFERTLAKYNREPAAGQKRIGLVAVSGASNVLGTYNDLASICRIAHQYGARVLVDAAQLVAHRRISMEEAGIDFLAFSGHKAYAPFGSGALIARKGTLNYTLDEFESARLSGEENCAGIAALGKALSLLQQIGMETVRQEEQALTRRALTAMAKVPGMTLPGINDPDSPRFADKGGVIVFILKNKMANVIAKKLAEQAGIGSRYGCHCSHLIVKHILNVKPGLEKFQHFMLTLLPAVQLPGIARISIGLENTPEDIDALVLALNEIAAGKKAKGRFNMLEFEKEAEVKIFR